MELNIPQHIQVEQPHPCVLKLTGLTRDDLRFGRKFYETPPDRMQGSLATNLREALHSRLTAIVFRYAQGEEECVGDLFPLKPTNLTSLPHADLSLRLLTTGPEQRLSTTLFTTRRDGLEAMLDAWDSSGIANERLLSAYRSLTQHATTPQPNGAQLYSIENDQLATANRFYLNAWWQFVRSNPDQNSRILFAYAQRVYANLGGRAYNHTHSDPNTHVLFSPHGLHSKRSTSLADLLNQDSPLHGKEVNIQF